ncbi:MAG: hypothetical protein ABIR24_11705 [Verrucomicrobiota bacterium]
MNQKLFKQCVAEFIGTFALIFVGVGAIIITPVCWLWRWVGPMIGGALACLVYGRFLIKEEPV